jgi:hypothetical protein
MLLPPHFQRTPHRHAFAVGGEHHDFRFRLGIRRRLRLAEAIRVRGQIAGHQLRRANRRLHAQQVA